MEIYALFQQQKEEPIIEEENQASSDNPCEKLRKIKASSPFMSWGMNLGQKMELFNALSEYKLQQLQNSSQGIDDGGSMRKRRSEPSKTVAKAYVTEQLISDMKVNKQLTNETSDTVQEKEENKILSRQKRTFPIFGFLSFLMLLLNSVLLINQNININN